MIRPNRWLSVFLLLSIVAALAGCGKLGPDAGTQTSGKLTVSIVIPNGGIGAQSFLDQITLSEVEVVVTQGTTARTATASVSGGTAQVVLDSLVPGTWTVQARVKDTAGYAVYAGTATATVMAGVNTDVSLTMSLVAGTLIVNVPQIPGATSGEATLFSPTVGTTVQTLTLDGSVFTTTFTNQVPGIRSLRVTLFNSSSDPIASGERDVNILPGRTTTAEATVIGSDGSLSITTSWELPPSAPTGLAAMYQSGNVTLSWTGSTSTGVSGYSVYRAEGETAPKKLITSALVSGESYDDSTAEIGKTYFYWVVAEAADGKTSTFSNTAGLTLIGGTVIHSGTEQPVADVTIMLSGDSISDAAVTATDGTWSASITPGSIVTLTPSLSGWTFAPATLTLSEAAADANFSGYPMAQDAVLRISLTWGANPSDLDSHLYTPPINSSEYHIWYQYHGSTTSPPYAKLDVDDVTSYGPEITTITQLFPGTYRYSINHYSGSGSLATSEARVDVYDSTGLIQTVLVPSTSEAEATLWWDVLEIDGATGAITVLNQPRSSDSSSLSGSMSLMSSGGK